MPLQWAAMGRRPVVGVVGHRRRQVHRQTRGNTRAAVYFSARVVVQVPSTRCRPVPAARHATAPTDFRWLLRTRLRPIGATDLVGNLAYSAIPPSLAVGWRAGKARRERERERRRTAGHSLSGGLHQQPNSQQSTTSGRWSRVSASGALAARTQVRHVQHEGESLVIGHSGKGEGGGGGA